MAKQLVFIRGFERCIFPHPIYLLHRQFLKFDFQGVCYEYCVLTFGLLLSLRVFVRCTEADVDPLQRSGIRLATYLDNWLPLAQSEQESRTHMRIVTQHLAEPGFVVNIEKSQLVLTKEISFLGLFLRSVPFITSPRRR